MIILDFLSFQEKNSKISIFYEFDCYVVESFFDQNKQYLNI